MSETPEACESRSNASKAELLALFSAMAHASTPLSIQNFFEGLARLSPVERLKRNLISVIAQQLDGKVPGSNVLKDGLSANERRALCVLDASNLPIVVRETAHGLLNVHERWLVMRALGKAFRNAAEAPKAHVGLRPLDGILGPGVAELLGRLNHESG